MDDGRRGDLNEGGHLSPEEVVALAASLGPDVESRLSHVRGCRRCLADIGLGASLHDALLGHEGVPPGLADRAVAAVLSTADPAEAPDARVGAPPSRRAHSLAPCIGNMILAGSVGFFATRLVDPSAGLGVSFLGAALTAVLPLLEDMGLLRGSTRRAASP